MSSIILATTNFFGGPITATFLGGREDSSTGRSTTAGVTYSSTTHTMLTSISNNMPSGTSLIVVVQCMEKTDGLYNGPNNDITDTDGNTWTRVAAIHDGKDSEVRVAVCELSSLPSSFTVHYNENRDRSMNTAWYALQNYKSTTPVATDTDTGVFTSTAGSITVTTQADDFVITGSIEDTDPCPLITGSVNMSSDFDTRYRAGSGTGNQISVVSETATGTSVTHTLPADLTRKSAAMASVVFR